MALFKQIQVGGPTNEILVGLDVDGYVWYNRGGAHHSDWIQLDLADQGATLPNMKHIVLWGEDLGILEALDVTGRMWSFAGDLSIADGRSAPEEIGDWVHVTNPSLPEAMDTLVAGVGASLCGLDSKGQIWALDPSEDSEWFRIPLELEKQYVGD